MVGGSSERALQVLGLITCFLLPSASEQLGECSPVVSYGRVNFGAPEEGQSVGFIESNVRRKPRLRRGLSLGLDDQ